MQTFFRFNLQLFCTILSLLQQAEPEIEVLFNTSHPWLKDIRFVEDGDYIKSISHPDDIQVPKSFDAREEWPKCKSFTTVENYTGFCENNWAYAVAGMLSDRICIASKQHLIRQYSTEEIYTCCPEEKCGPPKTRCTSEGNPFEALLYSVKEGVVSGGSNGRGCKPFNWSSQNTIQNSKRPRKSCVTKCTNQMYRRSYSVDKDKMKSKFVLVNTRSSRLNISQVQIEIMTNGPVLASLNASWESEFYEQDIFNESSVSVAASFGSHSEFRGFRIIGWGGEENDSDPYWLCINSMGEAWGMKGYFKITRGTNLQRLEEAVFAVEVAFSSARISGIATNRAILLILFCFLTLRVWS